MKTDTESSRPKIDVLTPDKIGGTDPYGTRYEFRQSSEFNAVDVYLTPKDGKTRVLGQIVSTDHGYLYDKQEDETTGIMNLGFCWSVPEFIADKVKFIRYTGKYAVYTITAEKAKAKAQNIQTSLKGWDRKIYVPITEWRVEFKDPFQKSLTPLMGLDWNILLTPYVTHPDFKALLGKLGRLKAQGIQMFPASADLFKAFKLCPIGNVKCVILGQDPYYSLPGQATGLAFGCGVEMSHSLRNILRELNDDLGEDLDSSLFEKEPFDISLEQWAKQGVLLLNTSLTVQKNKPGSHAGFGWDRLLVIPALKEYQKRSKYPTFLLWGAHAKSVYERIKSDKDFTVISAHPSPLSADKGFFGSRPFSKLNKYLLLHKQKQVFWR